MTLAKASGSKVRLERYGGGDTVYFAIMSEHDAVQRCVVTLDLGSLGFDPDGRQSDLLIDEIAQSTPISVEAPNEVALELKPFRTCIIVVRRTS